MKSQRRFPLLIVILALLLCSIGTFFSMRSPTPVKAATVPTGLHVVGNKIMDGSNRVIIPRGVNRMGTEYQCPKAGIGTDFDGPVDQASVSAMLTWNVNIVRVPLNEDCWLGINGLPANGKTVTQYRQDIMNWVSLLNQNGLMVILEMHWNNSGTNASTGQEPMPDLDHAPAFWTSVATTFKANSSILFDLYNEPFTTSWACWKNGSTSPSASPCNDVSFAVAGMQTLVNTVRATGATNIIMLGGLAFANDMSQWLANKPTDSLNNLVASTHIYNFNQCITTACWDTNLAPIAAQVPVLAGEIGENDCASGFINTLMTWLDQHNSGYLGWTWTATGDCNGSPSLITDYTGTPTNFGAGLKAHLLTFVGGGTTPTAVPITPTMRPITPTVTSTTTPVTGSSCKVVYVITNQWSVGFGTDIAITNTGSTAISSWTLQFSFANGQTLMGTQNWNGNFTQSGSAVTVTNVSYNGSIAPGATIGNHPGFNGNWSGTNAVPTTFKLNGVTCS